MLSYDRDEMLKCLPVGAVSLSDPSQLCFVLCVCVCVPVIAVCVFCAVVPVCGALCLCCIHVCLSGCLCLSRSPDRPVLVCVCGVCLCVCVCVVWSVQWKAPGLAGLRGHSVQCPVAEGTTSGHAAAPTLPPPIEGTSASACIQRRRCATHMPARVSSAQDQQMSQRYSLLPAAGPHSKWSTPLSVCTRADPDVLTLFCLSILTRIVTLKVMV